VRVALVNPRWSFEGSIYFGCRDPHLPLEYAYAKALLEAAGHQAQIVDAQIDDLDSTEVRSVLEAFGPDFTVITTAPSYLFWRCAPPELRVPQALIADVREAANLLVVVGPHASTTPGAVLRKLGAHAAILGECEEVIARLASMPRARWAEVESVATLDGEVVRFRGGKAASDIGRLPPVRWPDEVIARHLHHHHRFDQEPEGPGAEVEASRGCPYACTFCAKNDFRNTLRRRRVPVVLDEIDALVAQGVEYVYFIDEIFLPQRELLEALRERPISFGVQMRIDNWSPEMIDLLGLAGCVSIEAGVESVTPEGRALLAKKCRLSTRELKSLLVHAKTRVPFVQANLLATSADDPGEIVRFRQELLEQGVWANEPVPMFPYPGSPDYVLRWGNPDDRAWERAHAYYLAQFRAFSDIQEERPLPLSQLELPHAR
jgi:B12-binding domain/radical SAM domain protein of rhizo-twelve system